MGFAAALTTDPLGSVLVNTSDQILAFDAHNRLRARWRGPEGTRVSAVSNARGEVALGWAVSDEPPHVGGVLATVTGSHGPPVRFATRVGSSIATTIDAAGDGMLFWTDEGPEGKLVVNAHALATTGPIIQVARGQAP